MMWSVKSKKNGCCKHVTNVDSLHNDINEVNDVNNVNDVVDLIKV